MWSENKRLFLLIGLLALAGLAYVMLHGLHLPWSAPDEGSDVDSSGDAGTAAVTNPNASPGGSGTPGGLKGSTDINGGSTGTGQSAGLARSSRARAVYQKVTRIARQPKPKHLPQLKEAARSGDENTREVAVVAIARLGDSADPKVLIQALKSDESPAVRVAAATALGRLKCWEGGQALMNALRDPDVRVRSRAGTAIERIIGLRFGFRGNDPEQRREKAIQRIRMMWDGFYQAHLRHKAGRG